MNTLSGGVLRLSPAGTAFLIRNSNMTHRVKVIAILAARPGKGGELRTLLDGMVAPSPKGPGSLRYELRRDQADPNRFVLDELNADGDAVAD